MTRTILHVSDMDCPVEMQLITAGLGRRPGIEKLDFDLIRREVTVTHSLADPQILAREIRALGLQAELRLPTDGKPEATPVLAAGPLSLGWPLLVSGAAALAAEILAWTQGHGHAHDHGAHGGAEGTPPLIVGLAALSVACGGWQTLRKGWTALRRLTLNIHFLMMLAVAGAVAIGEWPEAAMVTFLFALAERIEARSLDRARRAIHELMALSPDRAWIGSPEGEWHEVEARQVSVGSRVRVRPGERVPLDGTIRSGASYINQAPITGENMPVEKGPGDAVFAGSVNQHGAFEFEVTAGTGETTLDRIVRTIHEAQSRRAPTERLVDQFARYYTPTVVALAVLLALAPPLLGQGTFLHWFSRSLVLLVIACPCALVLSTPVTVVSALAAAARQGLLVKGGSFLEEGRRLKVIAFDKTGTLTLGKPQVTDVTPLIQSPPGELLHRAASLNFYSEHPVAAAIVAHYSTAHADGGCRLLPVTEFEALTGRGVRGKIGGLNHFVGNHRLAEENQVCGPHVEAELARVEADGKTGVVLTTDKQALAVVAVSDTLRPGAREVVEELTAMGIQVALVSGDAAAPVASVARHVGVTTVHPELLPHEKARVIQSLRDCLGPIGMVGDGINDAPALACASVGFAMGAAGTASALETADVALMQDDLHKIPLFIRLSRATGAVLAQNIALAIGIKVVFFLLALVGHATLWMAVFADMGASLLVVANGLRLLRFERGRPQPTAPPVSADTPGHSHHHGAGECCGHTHGATVAASASDGAAGCGPTPGAPRAG